MTSPNRYRSGEASVSLFIADLLEEGKFAETYSLPPIFHFEREMAVGRGRTDYTLFHEDGSVTVIELKAEGSQTEVISGIGQLLCYMMQIGQSKGLTGPVRGLLMAPRPTEPRTADFGLIAKTCEKAGISFIALPTAEVLNAFLEDLSGQHYSVMRRKIAVEVRIFGFLDRHAPGQA